MLLRLKITVVWKVMTQTVKTLMSMKFTRSFKLSSMSKQYNLKRWKRPNRTSKRGKSERVGRASWPSKSRLSLSLGPRKRVHKSTGLRS